MPPTINTVLYCKAVEDSIRFVTIDKETGKQADFCKLFFPLGIDDGSLAFQHFLTQIDRTQKAEESTTDPEIIRAKVSRQLNKNNADSNSEDDPIPSQKPSLLTDEIAISKISIAAQELLKDLKPPLRAKIKNIERINSATQFDNTEITQGIIENQTDNDFSVEQEDLLLSESDTRKRNRLVWTSKSNDYSRVLVLASAGYGKSTLLTRIALFYCILQHEGRAPEEYEIESEFAAHYRLPYSNHKSWNYIPCLIRLRGVKTENTSIESIIQENIHSLFPLVSGEEILSWIGTIQERLLLLFDGLDELPEGRKRSFLDSLGEYLEKNRNTCVVLSSRVSGLSENGVKEKLQRMRFHGRTILPLSDKNIIGYCKQWIDVTQSEETTDKDSYLQLVESIQVEEKYRYLRDFMRKPLELTIILKQIVNKALSYNKWEMFYDMLWEQFTNHVPFAQKQGVFDDTMLFLSIISKFLQDHRTMYFEAGHLSELIQNLSILSFQTSDFIELTNESVIEKLNTLASNLGIVEKDDTQQEISYTFPIRAYQEFLTAYACCHVRINLKKTRPDPLDVLLPHVNDSYWNDVILYSLLDMESNHSFLLEEFKNAIFERCSSATLLQNIIESKVYIDLGNATTLCRINFCKGILDKQQLELLDACLHSETSYSFHKALLSLYKSCVSSSPWQYLDSVSYSQMNKAINNNEDIPAYVKNLLLSPEDIKRFIGAGTISLLARSILDEIPLINETLSNLTKKSASETLSGLIATTPNLFLHLRLCAKHYNSTVFIQALAEMWISKLKQTEQIISVLDRELLAIVYSQIIEEWKKGCSYKSDSSIINLLYTVSAFPISILPTNTLYPYPLSCFIKTLHSYSLYDDTLDRIALSVAQLSNGMTFEDFMTEWIWSICKGIPSRKIKKIDVSIRERNHFLLLREQLYSVEESYKAITRKQFNDFDEIHLLAKRILDLAVEYYQEAGYGQRTDPIVEDLYIKLAKGTLDSTASTNLAFLLRNGKIQSPLKELNMGDLINQLLRQGVQEKSPYALINMALKLIDDGKSSEVESLLSSMSVDDWNDVIDGWWYKMLWVRKRTEEGALVCLMARKYAGIEKPDYEEMVKSLSDKKEALSFVLTN